MTIQWRYERRAALGVLQVTGFLGDEAVDRFAGAIGWVLARGTGPLVLDLTELRAIDEHGQHVLAATAARLADVGRTMVLAGAAWPLTVTEGPTVRAFPDLPATLIALGEAPDDENAQPWRTGGWDEPAAGTATIADAD